MVSKLLKQKFKGQVSMLFNAGCNKKCFLLNPKRRKKNDADPSCRFREKHTF